MTGNNEASGPSKEDASVQQTDAASGTAEKAACENREDKPAVEAQHADNGAARAAGSQPLSPVPLSVLRRKNRPIWPTIVIVALVLVVGFFTFKNYMRPHERIEVTFNDLHGLHVGSPLEQDGDQIGEVVEIVRPEGLNGRKVIIELVDDPQVRDRLCRRGNEFHVSRFASDNMQLKGVTKVIRGPSVVVSLGDPQGEPRKSFQGKDSMPPDRRVQWNSVRTTVSFSAVHGLPEGAFVMERGREVGVVEKVIRNGDMLDVTLAFFTTDPHDCPYVRDGTRYFVNMAKLSPKGVQGEASTVLFGAHVVTVPDPCRTSNKVVEHFSGEMDSPPENLPRTGEKQVVLESASWLPPDTPIFYRGDLAGYVLRVVQASDSNSFDVVARIYPSAQPQICEKSVFFMQGKLKAQLFKTRGIFNWEGPRFEIPDPQVLLRPAIEFRTPPNSGKTFSFEQTSKPSFELHAEPKDDWLKWTSSIPAGEQPEQRSNVKLPQPVSAKFEWRESWKPLVSWHKHEGLMLPVPGGVIGPMELLNPSVAESKVVKPSFSVAGAAIDRNPGSIVNLGTGLGFMKAELKLAKMDFAPVATVLPGAQPLDCWVVIDSDQPKAIAAGKLATTAGGDQWSVKTDAGYQDDWHGAPVVCRDRSHATYGKVIGIFLVDKKTKAANISLFPPNVASLIG